MMIKRSRNKATGAMQHTAPTHRLNRRSRDFLLASGLVFLLGAALSVLGLVLHVIGLAVPSNPGFGAYDLTRKAMLSLGIGIIFVSCLMILRAVTWKTDNTLARQVGHQLAACFGRGFVFIRNISKATVGYVDAVLVSRHGVLVFRITNRKGLYFNEKGQWLTRKSKGAWKPMRWNPTRDAVKDVTKIREYLEDYKLMRIPVYGVVVFMQSPPQAQFILQEPTVPVLHAGQLPDGLPAAYFARERLEAKTVQEIVNLLYR